MNNRLCYKITGLIFLISLTACVSPSQHFDGVARELGFLDQKMSTELFQHKIYSNNKFGSGKTIHVYLDGDGTPWERNQWIANDPTARNPLILRLIAQDTTPAILLGRPCYYGLNYSSDCTSQYWTSHRYSKEVVQSMSQALKLWLSDQSYSEIVLIGYSGGGSIAILMANEIQNISKVVTVSANLNVTAWSRLHGYMPLKMSLNPSSDVKLNRKIEQFHFAGGNDEIVPAFIIKEFSNSQKNAQFFLFENFNHACCWEQQWKKILDIIG